MLQMSLRHSAFKENTVSSTTSQVFFYEYTEAGGIPMDQIQNVHMHLSVLRVHRQPVTFPLLILPL